MGAIKSIGWAVVKKLTLIVWRLALGNLHVVSLYAMGVAKGGPS
ncbi:hypothetical protein [Cupriavidus pauculus]|nr:hypothetical protein [Cupriavidus pauculus]